MDPRTGVKFRVAVGIVLILLAVVIQFVAAQYAPRSRKKSGWTELVVIDEPAGLKVEVDDDWQLMLAVLSNGLGPAEKDVDSTMRGYQLNSDWQRNVSGFWLPLIDHVSWDLSAWPLSPQHTPAQKLDQDALRNAVQVFIVQSPEQAVDRFTTSSASPSRLLEALRGSSTSFLWPFAALMSLQSLMLLIAFMSFRGALRIRRAWQAVRDGRCCKCGYSVMGLEKKDRCPECGTAWGVQD